MRHFSPGLVLISSKDKLWNRPQPFLALITLLSSRSVFPIICISQQGFFFFFCKTNAAASRCMNAFYQYRKKKSVERLKKMSKCPPTFFLPARCLWQWLWESVSDCPVTVIVFASIFFLATRKGKISAGGCWKQVACLWDANAPNQIFPRRGDTCKFWGEIGGNEQPRVRGEPFQAHGEVAAVWGNECSGVTVRNQLYFSGWRVCLWGDWLTEMAGSQFWERFQTWLRLTLSGETLLETNSPAIAINLLTN